MDASWVSGLRVLDMSSGVRGDGGWSTPSGRKRSGNFAALLRERISSSGSRHAGRETGRRTTSRSRSPSFARDWITREYLPLIERRSGSSAGEKVRLVVNRQLGDTIPEREAPQRIAATPAEEARPERFTFDTFVVGASNEVAFRAAQRIVEAPGLVFNPLFIHGGFGLGKTHLLSAIGHGIRHSRRGAGSRT